MKRTLIEKILIEMPRELAHFAEGADVYDSSCSPDACLWCATEWLCEEEVPQYLADPDRLIRMGRVRMYGTAVLEGGWSCLE